MADRDGRVDRATLMIGGLILAVGVLLLFRPYLGFMTRVWDVYWSIIRSVAVGLALIVAGIAVALGSWRRGAIRMPEKGERLHRSRERIVSGVLGGIAEYFRVDPLIVRLGFVAAVLLLGVFWQALVAYVILSIIMPEPSGASG